MYLGIDIGGTKTLIASFDPSGNLKAEIRFETPKSYDAWLKLFQDNLPLLKVGLFTAGAVAIPGEVDRKKGVGIKYGNLSWQNNPIREDLERIVKCPVVIENDAKVAGAYEAGCFKDKYDKIIYITIGTGVGVAYVVDGKNDLSVPDLGGAIMTSKHEGQLATWDSFASGRAIKEKYGKKVKDITNQTVWQEIVKNFAIVIKDLLNNYPAEAVIVGGGAGSHFEKFDGYLNEAMAEKNLIVTLVEVIKSEEAVIYGCFELARQRHENAN